MKYDVIIYSFDTKEEAEEAWKKAQREFCKWAAIINERQ